jgi:hypothetical protein
VISQVGAKVVAIQTSNSPQVEISVGNRTATTFLQDGGCAVNGVFGKVVAVQTSNSIGRSGQFFGVPEGVFQGPKTKPKREKNSSAAAVGSGGRFSVPHQDKKKSQNFQPACQIYPKSTPASRASVIASLIQSAIVWNNNCKTFPRSSPGTAARVFRILSSGQP